MSYPYQSLCYKSPKQNISMLTLVFSEGKNNPATLINVKIQETIVKTIRITHQAIHHRAQNKNRHTTSVHYFRFTDHVASPDRIDSPLHLRRTHIYHRR